MTADVWLGLVLVVLVISIVVALVIKFTQQDTPDNRWAEGDGPFYWAYEWFFHGEEGDRLD